LKKLQNLTVDEAFAAMWVKLLQMMQGVFMQEMNVLFKI